MVPAVSHYTAYAFVPINHLSCSLLYAFCSLCTPRLKAQPDVDPDRIIVAGWCYGGGAAVRYAAAHPGQAAGVAIFYGRPLLTVRRTAVVAWPYCTGGGAASHCKGGNLGRLP